MSGCTSTTPLQTPCPQDRTPLSADYRVISTITLRTLTQCNATFCKDFYTGKLTMRKKVRYTVRTVPLACSTVPQQIETVSIFHAKTVAANQSQQSHNYVARNSRPLQHARVMARKGKVTKFEIDADIEGLPIQT